MTYAKDEYDRNGHEITVQQVRGPDSSHGASEPSAWINGKAAYASEALEAKPHIVNDEMSDYEKVKAVAEYMVDNDLYFCRKCNTFYHYEEAATYGFCDHKCGQCNKADKMCDGGDSHDWKCTNPHQKRNARVSTKYRCTDCGKKKKTVPTG